MRCLAVLAGVLLAAPARSQTSSAPNGDFYKGRTISIVVGFSPGGSFDLYARMLSRHMSRHIPGTPSIIVQNMPGAGSLKAVDYLYSVAPRDGTVMATFNHTVPIEPLLGRAKFDPRQLAWIGSVASESSVCIASSRSPVKRLEDVSTHPFALGGTGRGSDTDMFANLLKTTLGLPVRLVTGYPGTTEIMLGVSKGELDGFCGIFYSSLKLIDPEIVRSGKVRVLAQAGLERHPEMPDAPMLLDYATTERQRQMMMLLIGPQIMARPYAMPPGTPADRVDTLRRAFAATMADPSYLADTSAARMVVAPVDADRIVSTIAEIYRTPADVLSEATTAFGN